MTDLPAPMLPGGPARAPFTSPEWLYELQFAGTRCMAWVAAGAPGDPARVRLRAADGQDATGKFPDIVRGLAALPGGPHLLDGTASALHGPEYGSGSPAALCVSDLLVHDGEDVTRQPMMARKARLHELLQGADPRVLLAAGSLPADAGLLHAMLAVGQDVAAVIAKRKASLYRPATRSTDWVLLDTGANASQPPGPPPG
jgi:bifunctional non-homologous end joining protein LigD